MNFNFLAMMSTRDIKQSAQKVQDELNEFIVEINADEKSIKTLEEDTMINMFSNKYGDCNNPLLIFTN